jgi:Putative vitamin uptake transporter
MARERPARAPNEIPRSDHLSRLHPIGELDDQQRRDHVRPQWPLPYPGWVRTARIGLALVLRDFVQCHLDRDWTITAVLAGATLSAIVAPPVLVAASMASFLLSELADMGVYTPLRERRLALAVLASGLVGAIVDSAVFLLLAFGNLAYIEGLIVGKL